jgi:hypothetical protein
MEVEVTAEAKGKLLNRMVAVSVVFFSIFMGVSNIKDGNLVQNMQVAKADAVDTWSEYQATRTKLHIAESALAQDRLLAGSAPKTALAAETGRLTGAIAKYEGESKALAAKAKGLEGDYDAMNVHDDQFDASEALISIAVSLAAVAALAEAPWVLYTGWVFGAFGVLMGVAGFAKWGLHPDFLSSWLG